MNDEINKNIDIAEKIAQEIKNKNGRMFFVGGFVRDRLMNKENKDIDVEIFRNIIGRVSFYYFTIWQSR